MRTRKREAIRRGEIHLEPLLPETCGATFDGNDYCTLIEGHEGQHNIRRGEE